MALTTRTHPALRLKKSRVIPLLPSEPLWPVELHLYLYSFYNFPCFDNLSNIFRIMQFVSSAFILCLCALKLLLSLSCKDSPHFAPFSAVAFSSFSVRYNVSSPYKNSGENYTILYLMFRFLYRKQVEEWSLVSVSVRM